jgi:hypothetical protein
MLMGNSNGTSDFCLAPNMVRSLQARRLFPMESCAKLRRANCATDGRMMLNGGNYGHRYSIFRCSALLQGG